MRICKTSKNKGAVLLREVSRVNVSADKPVCILLKFTYTNTETWRRLKVLLSKLVN